jgi:cell division protein FtsW (lipid II flippase)
VYGGSLALLAGVLTPLGATVNGTKGWYRIGPLQLQPAEFAKVAMIVAIAAYLGSGERVDLRRLFGALMLMGGPVALTMLQPDLGSSLVFIVAGLGMMVVGGVKLRHLAVLVALGAVAVVGIGALALGVVMMVIWWIASPDFFHGLTLPMRNSADLVMLPATGTEAMFGLPDSGDMPTIIAPDLSNLPAGETAINPETGEEFTKGG